MLNGRSSHRPLILSMMLGATVLIMGIIAYYAISTTLSHDDTINSALKDKAQHASWSLDSRMNPYINMYLGYYVPPIINSANAYIEDNPETPFVLDLTMDDLRSNNPNKEFAEYFCEEYNCLDLDYITPLSAFVIKVDQSEYFNTTFFSEHSSEGFKEWVNANFHEDYNYATPGNTLAYRTAENGDEYVIIYGGTELMDEFSEQVVFGYEFPADELDVIFKSLWEQENLMPTSYLSDNEPRELMDIEIRSEKGTEIYSTKDQDTDFVLREEIDIRSADFLHGYVYISENEETGYLTSGIAANRIPLLGILFTLALGLSIIAFLQYRRELELTRIRSEFISNVSHELRTPVTQIRLFSETLEHDRTRSPEERQRALKIISKESYRLGNLINNVLDFSRSERNVMEVHPVHVNVHDVIEETVEAFTPLAESAKSRLQLQTDQVVAETDPSILRQILLNLLDNAAKYGATGQTIRIFLKAQGDHFLLSVEDEGEGIPEELADKIWDPFWRDNHQTKSARTGSGIGLSVVKQYVSLLRGHIRVRRGDRGGAYFELILPVKSSKN